MPSIESIAMSPETLISSKKDKKMAISAVDDDSETLKTVEKKKKEKKDKSEKKKKRKAEEVDDGSDTTTSEVVEPSVIGNNNKKKVKLSEDVVVAVDEEDDPNSLSKFRISKPLKDALVSRGIKALFPIQAMTFDAVVDGSDLVGRARTGQGKTLAFVLPILESLVNGRTKSSRKTGYGKSPSVLVLLPTRELATQLYERKAEKMRRKEGGHNDELGLDGSLDSASAAGILPADRSAQRGARDVVCSGVGEESIVRMRAHGHGHDAGDGHVVDVYGDGHLLHVACYYQLLCTVICCTLLFASARCCLLLCDVRSHVFLALAKTSMTTK